MTAVFAMQHHPKFRASWEGCAVEAGLKAHRARKSQTGPVHRRLPGRASIPFGHTRGGGGISVLCNTRRPRLVFVATRGAARPRPSGKGEHEARPLPLRPTHGYGRSLNFRSGRRPESRRSRCGHGSAVGLKAGRRRGARLRGGGPVFAVENQFQPF